MTHEKYKKRKFVTSLSKNSVKKSTAPRKTKRAWMRDECYIYKCEVNEQVLTLNVMEVAERMCKSNKWEANTKTNIPLAGMLSSNQKLKALWTTTMQYKGAPPRGEWGTSSIRITKGKFRGTGHAGASYGVTMRCAEATFGDTLGVLLHELVHVIQGGQTSRINGKRRPHDLRFNLILTRMAKSFFGYNFHPYEVGFSVGRGYAPSRHLEAWLKTQIEESNPKVLKWFSVGG